MATKIQKPVSTEFYLAAEEAFGITIPKPPSLTEEQEQYAQDKNLRLVYRTALSMRDLRKNWKGPGKLLFSEENSAWYTDDPFYSEPMAEGWFLISPDILPGSTFKAFAKQDMLLGIPDWRPTATEVIYDLALTKVLGVPCSLTDSLMYSWTRTRSSDGYLVVVGGFDAGGAYVSRFEPDDSGSCLGVSFSRSLKLWDLESDSLKTKDSPLENTAAFTPDEVRKLKELAKLIK